MRPTLADFARSHLTLAEADAVERMREQYEDDFILSLWECESSRPVRDRIAAFLARNPRRERSAA